MREFWVQGLEVLCLGFIIIKAFLNGICTGSKNIVIRQPYSVTVILLGSIPPSTLTVDSHCLGIAVR